MHLVVQQRGADQPVTEPHGQHQLRDVLIERHHTGGGLLQPYPLTTTLQPYGGGVGSLPGTAAGIRPRPAGGQSGNPYYDRQQASTRKTSHSSPLVAKMLQ
ncbi:hypothetical protein GCM10019016_010620 [Streptomyces prasinosporus]|uniref:Uncharacterized protein n=1 Tax=Streptomyces prasinosporus TaxID=68256 RepID=A0ABP6THF1_9ACTN